MIYQRKSHFSENEYYGFQTAFVYTLNALTNENTYYVKTFEQSDAFVILIDVCVTELSFGID